MSKNIDWVALADELTAKASCVGHIDPTGKTLTVQSVRRDLQRLRIPHTLPPRSTLPGSTTTDTE